MRSNRWTPCATARTFRALTGAAPDGRGWTNMPVGPFDDEALLQAHLQRAAASTDPLHFAVVDALSHQALGTMALLRMDPTNGVIEVGHIAFSPALQRARAATEAQYLLMHLVFHELGYRRYEWKCDRLNAPSRQAAARLGFQFEGTFRPGRGLQAAHARHRLVLDHRQ